jgi:hypothetical protein
MIPAIQAVGDFDIELFASPGEITANGSTLR